MTQQEFEQLQAKCQPHPVLNKDFMRYYPLSFANAFLPKAPLLYGKGFEVYDGAGLFSAASGQLKGDGQKARAAGLHEVILFSAPIDTMANDTFERMQCADDELAVFVSIDQAGDTRARFCAGNRFIRHVELRLKAEGRTGNARSLLSKEYPIVGEALTNLSRTGVQMDSLYQFALELLGLNTDPLTLSAIGKVSWIHADGKPVGIRKPTTQENRAKVNQHLHEVRYGELIQLKLSGSIYTGKKVKISVQVLKNGIVDHNAPSIDFTVTGTNGEVQTPFFPVKYEWYDEAAEEYLYGEYLTHVPDHALISLTATATIDGHTYPLDQEDVLTPYTYRRNYEELVGLYYRPKNNRWEGEEEEKRGTRDGVQNYENALILDPDNLANGNRDINKLADSFVEFIRTGRGLTADELCNRVETDAAQLWQLATAQARSGNLDDRPLYWARNKMQTWLKRHPAFKNEFDLMTSTVKPDTDLASAIRRFEELSRNYTGISFENAEGDKDAQEKIRAAETAQTNAYALPLDDAEREQKIADAEAGLEKAKKVFKILITGFDPFQLNEFKDYGNILQSNPSGCVALSLHGLSLGQGYIQTMIVPVRYTDFDSSTDPVNGQGTGIVENYIGKWIKDVDMIITVSQADFGEYHIDVFATAVRGGGKDNLKHKRAEGDFSIRPPVTNNIVTTLKSAFTSPPSKAEYFGKYFKTKKEALISDYKLRNSSNNSTTDNIPDSKVFYGPGGNYLSNEIFYRVSFLRNSQNPTLQSGHFHVAKIQDRYGIEGHVDYDSFRMKEAMDVILKAIELGVKAL